MATTRINEPSLVVGLGKVGTSIVRRLKQRVRIRLPEQQRVRLLCLDFFTDGGNSEYILAPYEMFPLSLLGLQEFCRLQNVKTSIAGQDILQYLVDDSEPEIAAHAHLAFLKQSDQIELRTSEILEQLLSPVGQGAWSQQSSPSTEEVSVFVVSSLCDKGGAGILLDYGELLTHLSFLTVRDMPLRTRAVLMLPQGEGADANMLRAQAYATLKELFSERKNNPGIFDYGCYLVGDSNEKKNIAELSQSAIESFVAEWLYQMTVTTMRDGVSQNPPMDYPSNGSDITFTVSGFGLVSYQIPTQEIIRYCGARCAIQRLEDCLENPQEASLQEIAKTSHEVEQNAIGRDWLTEQIDTQNELGDSILNELLPTDHPVELPALHKILEDGLRRFEQTELSRYVSNIKNRRLQIVTNSRTFIASKTQSLLNALPQGSIGGSLQFLKTLEKNAADLSESISRESSEQYFLLKERQREVDTTVNSFPSRLNLHANLRTIIWGLGALWLIAFLVFIFFFNDSIPLLIFLGLLIIFIVTLMLWRWRLNDDMRMSIFLVREWMRLQIQLRKNDLVRSCLSELSAYFSRERSSIDSLNSILQDLVEYFGVWANIIEKLEPPPTQVILIAESYASIYERLSQGHSVPILTGNKIIASQPRLQISAWRNKDRWELIEHIWESASEPFRIIESADINKIFIDYCRSRASFKLTEKETLEAEIQSNFIPNLFPLWDYRDVFARSKLQRLFGVTDTFDSRLTSSWRDLLGSEPRIINTQDPHAIVGMSFRHAVPLWAIPSFLDCLWYYQQAPNKFMFFTRQNALDTPEIGTNELVWKDYEKAKPVQKVIDHYLLDGTSKKDEAKRLERQGDRNGFIASVKRSAQAFANVLAQAQESINRVILLVLSEYKEALHQLVALLLQAVPDDLRQQIVGIFSQDYAADSDVRQFRGRVAQSISYYWTERPEFFLTDVRNFLLKPVRPEFFKDLAEATDRRSICRISQALYRVMTTDKGDPIVRWIEIVNDGLAGFRELHSELLRKVDRVEKRQTAALPSQDQESAVDITELDDAIRTASAMSFAYDAMRSLLILSGNHQGPLVQMQEEITLPAKDPLREVIFRFLEILKKFEFSINDQDVVSKLDAIMQGLGPTQVPSPVDPESRVLQVIVEHLYRVADQWKRVGVSKPDLVPELLSGFIHIHATDQVPRIAILINNTGTGAAHQVILVGRTANLLVAESLATEEGIPPGESRLVFVELKPYLELIKLERRQSLRFALSESSTEAKEFTLQVMIAEYQKEFDKPIPNPYAELVQAPKEADFEATASTNDLLLEPSQKIRASVSFDDGAIWLIERLSGNIPYFVNLLARELINFMNQMHFARPFTAWDVECVTRQIVKDSESMGLLWRLLSPRQQVGIISAAEAKNRKGLTWLTLSDISSAMLRLDPDADILAVLQDALSTRLVSMHRDRSLFKVNSELLARWVLQRTSSLTEVALRVLAQQSRKRNLEHTKEMA